MSQTKETKRTTVELKEAGDEGSFEAVIATFDQLDSDGDIVKKGAFNGASVPILPAHHQGSVPLGKAKIEERGDKAVAVGRFNLDVSSARDWHAAIKFDLANPPASQEWSWGYYPINPKMEERDGEEVRILSEVDLLEVSPVLRGASVGTGTLSAKARKIAVRSHETATSDAPWNGPANELRLESGEDLPKAAPKAYAWRDPDGDPEAKSAWRFIHHFVDSEGEPGAASIRACITGIAVLNGARGGTTIPESDRKGVYAHLAKHLRDADIEPPELRSAEECGIKLIEHVRLVTWEAETAVDRLRSLSQMRSKDGKDLPDELKAEAIEMASAFEEMLRCSGQLAALVERCTPEDAVSQALDGYRGHRARFG